MTQMPQSAQSRAREQEIQARPIWQRVEEVLRLTGREMNVPSIERFMTTEIAKADGIRVAMIRRPDVFYKAKYGWYGLVEWLDTSKRRTTMKEDKNLTQQIERLKEEHKESEFGVLGKAVGAKYPGRIAVTGSEKPRPNIVVQHNVEGSGKPVCNVANYCTRFKFNPYSSYISFNGESMDQWQKAVSELPGVTEVASYSHNGLYDLVVKKATAYGWEEIEPQILELLELRHEELTLKEVLAKPPSPKVPKWSVPMNAAEGAEWKSPHGAPAYVPLVDKPGTWGALQDEASRSPFMNLAADGGAGNDNEPGELPIVDDRRAKEDTELDGLRDQADLVLTRQPDGRFYETTMASPHAAPHPFYEPFEQDGDWWFREPGELVLSGPYDTEALACKAAEPELSDPFSQAQVKASEEDASITENYGDDGSGGH